MAVYNCHIVLVLAQHRLHSYSEPLHVAVGHKDYPVVRHPTDSDLVEERSFPEILNEVDRHKDRAEAFQKVRYHMESRLNIEAVEAWSREHCCRTYCAAEACYYHMNFVYAYHTDDYHSASHFAGQLYK